MSTTAQIQSLLDENKEQIGNGLYLTLCNKMKEINEQECIDQGNTLYEVTYIYVKIDTDSNVNDLKSRLIKNTQIIQLTNNEFEYINSKIENGNCNYNSTCEHHKNIFTKLNYNKNIIHHFHPTFDMTESEDEYNEISYLSIASLVTQDCIIINIEEY